MTVSAPVSSSSEADTNDGPCPSRTSESCAPESCAIGLPAKSLSAPARTPKSTRAPMPIADCLCSSVSDMRSSSPLDFSELAADRLTDCPEPDRLTPVRSAERALTYSSSVILSSPSLPRYSDCASTRGATLSSKPWSRWTLAIVPK